MSEHKTKSQVFLGELAALSDRELFIRYRGGEARAALALIERYADPLFNIACRTTGSRAAADEATRTVLIAALRHTGERASSAAEPTANKVEWFATDRIDGRWIVVLAGQLYRQLVAMGFAPQQPAAPSRIAPRHWETARLEIADDAQPSPRQAAQDLRRRLWRAFSGLAMRQRFVITLTEAVQLTPAELGAVFGETEAAARRARDDAKLALLARLAAQQERWRERLADRRRARP